MDNTPPGAVFLLAGRHVAGAHRSPDDFRFAAIPGSIAFLHMPDKSQGIRPVKDRIKDRIPFARMNAQGAIHGWRMDDFTRIENPRRIPALFDLLDQLKIVCPKDDRYKLSAKSAIAVLSA